MIRFFSTVSLIVSVFALCKVLSKSGQLDNINSKEWFDIRYEKAQKNRDALQGSINGRFIDSFQSIGKKQ